MCAYRPLRNGVVFVVVLVIFTICFQLGGILYAMLHGLE